MNPRRRVLSMAACAALLTIVAFGRAVEAPFFWDDKVLILANPHLGRPADIPRFFSTAFWAELSCPEDYRPAQMISHSIDHLFWARNPWGHHLTNLLLHVFNGLAVFILVRMLLRSDGAAAAACVLFMLHPAHVETVVWIQNRSDLLAAALSLVCLIAFLAAASRRDGGPRLLLVSSAALALACLAKESAVAVPLACGALAPALRPRPRRWWPALLIPLAAVAGAFLLLKLTVLGVARFQHPSPLAEAGPAAWALSVAKTVAVYIAVFAFPVNLTIARPFISPTGAPAAAPLLLAAAVLLLAAWSLRAARRGRAAGAGALFFLATILPASNIIFLAGRPISEQRLYVPSIGLCLLLGAILAPVLRRRAAARRAAAIVMAVALACATIAARRTDIWRDERGLWERTVEEAPGAVRPKISLGRIYRLGGRHAEAVSLLKAALRASSPWPPQALTELGCAYEALGWHAEAIDLLSRAVAGDPVHVQSRLLLAAALQRERRHAEALEQYRAVERLLPVSGLGPTGAALAL
ncbi:MAG: tetratricopeptide repeat protein, partial [bacterium]|nr:tetratricopeptide repeat protein [bacterium]